MMFTSVSGWPSSTRPTPSSSGIWLSPRMHGGAGSARRGSIWRRSDISAGVVLRAARSAGHVVLCLWQTPRASNTASEAVTPKLGLEPGRASATRPCAKGRRAGSPYAGLLSRPWRRSHPSAARRAPWSSLGSNHDQHFRKLELPCVYGRVNRNGPAVTRSATRSFRQRLSNV